MQFRDVLYLVGFVAPAAWLLSQTSLFHATPSQKNVGNLRSAADPAQKVGLIVVDVQDCFTENGIGLGNPRGNLAFKAKVNTFVGKVREAGGAVALLQDYHPTEHISFGNVATNDPDWAWDPTASPAQTWEGPLCQKAVDWDNANWYESEAPNYNLPAADYLSMKGDCEKHTEKNVTQPLFPAHCVQGTDEVHLTSLLCETAGGQSVNDTCVPAHDDMKVVRKGMNPGIDSFGGIWDNRVVEGILQDTDSKAHWGLFHFFKQRAVTHVIHIGIADDFCVKETSFASASDLAKTSFGIQSASVVPSLSFGIFQQLADREDTGKEFFGAVEKSAELIAAYETAGVKMETEEQALARLVPPTPPEDFCTRSTPAVVKFVLLGALIASFWTN